MFRIFDQGTSLCDGLSRREWLRIGGLALGNLSLAGLSRARAAEPAGRSLGKAKSVIVLWFVGGVPQHETWDTKPEAPAEIRGPFGTISSRRTPGMNVGELMPKTAQLTDKIAVIRNMVTGDNAHSSSGYQMLTGIPHTPLSRENALPGKPNDWPSINAMMRVLRTKDRAMPPSITLPRGLANVGDVVWPGQGGGFLGRQYDPWVLACDPADKNFAVPGCEMAADVTPLRFDDRFSLLDQFNQHLDLIQRSDRVKRYDQHADQAIDLLGGGKARSAFDLNRESDATRDRYGRDKFGQSVLLAKRLVEAGVSLVQVNWSAIEGKENHGSWDTHKAHNASLKDFLMPMMDQTYTALLEDLANSGRLDETLVVWMGEFGHTPKFNAAAGRDHWGRVFSIAARREAEFAGESSMGRPIAMPPNQWTKRQRRAITWQPFFIALDTRPIRWFTICKGGRCRLRAGA